jgi:hypothetical protein
VSFLERYQTGELVSVWSELIDFGREVLEKPLRSEALEVCEEIVRRARLNLRMLHTRLLDLGYEFAEPHAALVDAAPDAGIQIEEFERKFGTFPLIARVWYQTLGSVNFCQAVRQRAYRQGVRPPAGPDIFGLGSHPVLIFQSLERCREQLHQMAAQQEEYICQMKEGESGECVRAYQFLPLGGWASNCEPKGFRLPCSGVDAVIYNDGGGDIYFVDELRSAFRWGGFPFWQSSLQKPDFDSPMEYRPNFAKLLLPQGRTLGTVGSRSSYPRPFVDKATNADASRSIG